MSMSMAEVLQRQLQREGDIGPVEPKKSIPYETFYHKSCCKCGAPCDLKRYFGKRKYAYPYCKKCKAAYMRAWRRRNEMSPKERRKDNCRSYAGTYLRRGKIKKSPCQHCGSIESQMHHPDYDKPLLIEWMCRPCHLGEHYGSPGPLTSP